MHVEEAWPLCHRNRAELYTISTSTLNPRDPVTSPTKQIKDIYGEGVESSKKAFQCFSNTLLALQYGSLPQRCLRLAHVSRVMC